MEIDCADSDIDSDCTGDDAGSDVVYVRERKKESWAHDDAQLSLSLCWCRIRDTKRRRGLLPSRGTWDSVP